MKTYFATCIPGVSEVVAETLLRDIPDCQIIRLFESSILFQTEKKYIDVASKMYLNNVFLVLNFFNLEKEWMDGSLAKELHKRVEYNNLLQSDPIFRGNKTMRVMVQKGSKLVHIPRQISKKIIAEITSHTKLRHDPLHGDIEWWFLIRNEQIAVYGVKPTTIKASLNKEIQDGEIRPQLAHILNLLSEPHQNDCYLDPFAGHGALAWDRMHNFPYRTIYVSDIQAKHVKNYDKLYQNNTNIVTKLADARSLSYLKNKSVSTIVTDPPWGFYEFTDIDYEEFYSSMLTEMYRVVTQGGIIVLLTARTAEFEAALNAFPQQFTLKKQYAILVNGKKATIYKLKVV